MVLFIYLHSLAKSPTNVTSFDKLAVLSTPVLCVVVECVLHVQLHFLLSSHMVTVPPRGAFARS